ncbi:MAG TPA: response regulator, partial [Steroidobacteraceae bacterium]|nr:response regulator [Steroidobacteraceae bacterium]
MLEDDPISVEIVGAYLRAISFADVKLHSAVQLSDALALLAHVDVDLVVADLHLPDSHGAATIRSLVSAVGCPVIAITADRDPGLRDATLACGAFEFLQKDDLTETTLMRLVRLATMQARTDRSLRESRQAEAALRESEGRFRNLALFGHSALAKAAPAELLEKAARAMFDALAADAVAYLEREPGSTELLLRAVVSRTDLGVGPGRIHPGPDDPITRAIATGQLVLAEGVHLPFAWARELRSAL